MMISKNSRFSDNVRQALILIASPLIWVFSSLGVFIESARSPGEFSDLSQNLLVPQTTAFSIWFPIFLGILAYGIVQAKRSNRTRAIFQESGWYMALGLWGVALWGLVTAYVPDTAVELLATLIFIPTMICLVIAMTKIWRRRSELIGVEKWLVLTPVSLIAGWCSIAVFIGFNGLVWKTVEPLAWSLTGTALSILSLALWWVIFVLRQKARSKAYAIPIVWGLGFLAFRHFAEGGNIWIGSSAALGVAAVILAALIPLKTNLKEL